MSDEKTLKELILQRGIYKGQLTKLSNFLDTFISDNEQITILTKKLEKTELLWEKFQECQLNIQIIKDDETQVIERDEFEDIYYKVTAKAQQLIDEFHKENYEQSVASSHSATPYNNTNNMRSVKLPKIDLPKFDGSYSNYEQFFDSFQSMIDNDESLPNHQKLHYLKSCLTGDALKVIDSLKVTDVNYEIAWKLIKEQYADKRAIMNSHFKNLFDLPVMNKYTPDSLKLFLNTIQREINCLKDLLPFIDDNVMLYLFESKLDQTTKIAWEANIEQEKTTNNNETLPTIEKFEKFLKSRLKVIENAITNQIKVYDNHSLPNKRFNKITENKTLVHFSTNKTKCIICGQTHFVYQCKTFLDLAIPDRLKEVKKHKLCINCLRSNHFSNECLSTSACRRCNKKHNTLLHLNDFRPISNSHITRGHSEIQSDTNVNNIQNENSNIISTHSSQPNKSQILLSTAEILIYCKNKQPIKVRCLLDSGSQSNFITSDLVNKLQLKPFKINIPISGVNQSITQISYGVNTKIKSVHNGFDRQLTFLVLDNITNYLPGETFKIDYLNIPQNLTLADPEFNKSQKIDLLLGAQIFFDLLCIGQIKLGPNQPTMQKTHLGWIISGPMKASYGEHCLLAVNKKTNSNEQIQNTLEKFWSVEEISEHNTILNKDDQYCEKHFTDNFKFENNHFVVSLPTKPNYIDLGESFESAKKRFFQLEKRIHLNAEFGKAYSNFMREFEALNHMTKLKEHEIDISDKLFYLPHHGVFKNSSVSTKIRVVFDGSNKSSSNLSLNDVLYVGPTIQDDLFSILIRFRKYSVVLKADITKMYRQVYIEPKQRNLQRILWRENKTQELNHYQLNTVTYGTGPAAFLAIRSLHQAAYNKMNTYPNACKIILTDFYVDDLITGTDNINSCQKLKSDISSVLEMHGFPLTQWMSNRLELLNTYEQSQMKNYIIDEDQTVKTLGILWNPTTDTFQYSINENIQKSKITKRTMLSIVSQIFDPLGLIAPVIIQAKIMLQNIWKLQLTWDEAVSQDIYVNFINFMNGLKCLNNVKIPRHIIKNNYTNIQLHGFSDSSESAYGACIYLRTKGDLENYHSYLLCAKSRVAPLKVLSLPRLELCGALLLSKLVNKVLKCININFTNIYLWTDSTIVLSWLSREPSHWKTFVANRVAEISRLTSNNCTWLHVASSENPSDLITRGSSVNDLINNQLWWSGPDFLHSSTDQFNNSQHLQFSNENVLEMKRIKISSHFSINLDPIFSRISDFKKLRNVTAFCLRFINNIKPIKYSKMNKISGDLKPFELDNAIKTLVKIAQTSCFNKEISDLKTKSRLSKKSKLLSLNVFLDPENILRVGGRLSQADIHYDKKFPMLLPSNHEFTKSLITYEHEITLHGGVQTVLSKIRTKFWPINAKNAIKGILRKCIKCYKVKPKTYLPFMGNLPSQRITPTRPFLTSGVDFAGPFLIKDGTLRNAKFVKVYICLFICFTTKAIHLELAGDLMSETFLNCLKRFIARRGICKNLYSDNGLNFIGANNLFKKSKTHISNLVSENNIRNFLLDNFINWHFIPPHAPNFGGLWESSIKQMKVHLVRILGESKINYESFYTVLTTVEAILNSRPIAALSNDPNDLLPLTPGHFLIGEPLNTVSEMDIQHIPENRLKLYQRLLRMTQNLWSRWSREYLHQLQQRHKWTTQNCDIPMIGTLVLLKEDNLPPLLWKTGRITEVFPGNDNIVRVVNVKTQSGILKRAINKLCPLPIID